MENAIKLFLDKTNYARKQILKVERLKKGFTNESYKISTQDGLAFQVRLCNNKMLNRQIEHYVYKSLNIPLIHFDEKTGNMIRQWADGKIVKRWNAKKIDLIVSKLHLFHAIEPNKIPKFNAFIFTDLLSKKNEMENEMYTEYVQLLKKYPDDKTIVCHCDLNPNNILFDKKQKEIHIIDFEWTRLNSPYFELANLARENMKKKQIIYLAKSYGDIDLNILKDYLIITSLYAYQWTLFAKNAKNIIKYRNHVLKRLKYIRTLDFTFENNDVVANTKTKQPENNNESFIKFKYDATKHVRFDEEDFQSSTPIILDDEAESSNDNDKKTNKHKIAKKHSKKSNQKKSKKSSTLKSKKASQSNEEKNKLDVNKENKKHLHTHENDGNVASSSI